MPRPPAAINAIRSVKLIMVVTFGQKYIPSPGEVGQRLAKEGWRRLTETDKGWSLWRQASPSTKIILSAHACISVKPARFRPQTSVTRTFSPCFVKKPERHAMILPWGLVN